MDIGIVHPELIYPRGAEKQVCQLSYWLNKMGHGVTIYTFEKNDNYLFDHLLENVEVISLDTKWVVNGLFDLNQYRWAYLIRKLSSKIKGHDVINAHNHPAQWISKFTDIPTVWMCNEPYPKKNRLDSSYSANVKLALSISTVIEEMVKDRYPQLNVETVGSGAGLDMKVVHEDNEFFDLVFVGPLHPKKRQLDIIEAFSLIGEKIPNVRLHFVGGEVGILSKRLKNRMKEQASKNHIEIHLYDSVSDDELYKLYSIADISVFVPESEPWGIFPLETILGGITTVVSDQCGVKDLVDKELVVETGNVQELADKILEVVADPMKFSEKTLRSANLIQKNYSWQAYTERMEQYFSSVIK